jgi:hypothetical protein
LSLRLFISLYKATKVIQFPPADLASFGRYGNSPLRGISGYGRRGVP